MRIFVAGASGALGRQLVPRLAQRGHEVTGMMRSESRRELVASLGARPVVADALDPDAVGAAVSAAEPDVVVHQLTALSAGFDARHLDRTFAGTNRLRTEGTDNLLSAAQAAGVERFVAQSYSGWPYARVGGPVKTEDDPLDLDPPAALRSALEAIAHLEAAVVWADWTEGIVLRYGGFYGPGTSLAAEAGAEQAEAVLKRKFPIVGSGDGVWSLVHIADAAEATVAAIEHGSRGVYNVVDDEPAPVREWLPVLASNLGAPAPRRVPRWLGRLAGGQGLVTLMCESRGASNAKARRELGWELRYPSWRQGFAHGLEG